MIHVRLYCPGLPQLRDTIEFVAAPDGSLHVAACSPSTSAEHCRHIAVALAQGQTRGEIDGFAWVVEELEGPCL